MLHQNIMTVSKIKRLNIFLLLRKNNEILHTYCNKTKSERIAYQILEK